jgi:hypothetical protein
MIIAPKTQKPSKISQGEKTMSATTLENRLADVLARVLQENPELVELLAKPIAKKSAKATTPPKTRTKKSTATKKTEALQAKIEKVTSREVKPRAKTQTASARRLAKQAESAVPVRPIDSIRAWTREGFAVGEFTIDPHARITSIVYSSKVSEYRAYMELAVSEITVSEYNGVNFVEKQIVIRRCAWFVNRVSDGDTIAVLWCDEIEGNQGDYVRKFMQSL